jgi:hypothetical protein
MKVPPKPSIDCCEHPFYPETVETSKESPKPVMSIKKIHEYIKRKVFECKQQDAAHESTYTNRFRRYMQVLKRIHLKFDPIVCLTPDSSLLYFYPCPDFHCDGTCNVFSIRKRVPYGKRVPFNSVQQAYCESCYVEARKNDVGCDKERNQRTAPNSHVPILSLTNGEKVEKIHCLIDERRKYVREERVHAAKTRMEKPVLTVSELSDEWQEVLSRTMTMIEASTDRKHSKIPWKSDEANQFTEFILSEMKNKAQVMSGRDTTVQFSLGILRTITYLVSTLPGGLQRIKRDLSTVSAIRSYSQKAAGKNEVVRWVQSNHLWLVF